MLAFLFVWQVLFAGPLEIATGNIGLVYYLKVFWPAMTALQMKFTAAGIGIFLIFVLYRRIADIAKIMLPELCTDSLCECGCVRSGLAVVVRW